MKPIGSLILLTTALGPLGALSASDFKSLVDRSPFAPPPDTQVNLAAPATEPGTLEFRGVAVDDSGSSYSIFDATANRGYWIREGGDGPIRLKTYNPQEAFIEVEQNGRPVKLQMKRATIQAGAAVAPPRPLQPGAPGAPSANNNPADGRRLEAVAAEVRRRRALRNASAAAPAPAAAAQPAPPAPPAQAPTLTLPKK